MKLRTVMGTVTIIAIVGGTIYAIKKAKDSDKIKGEEISLDEAKAIVGARKNNPQEVYRNAQKCVNDFDSVYPTYFEDKTVETYSKADIEATRKLLEELTEGEMDEVIDDSREMASYNSSFIRSDDAKAPYAEEEYEEEENTEIENIEGDGELRYEPSSREARNQFIKMELAEWVPLEDSYQILQSLFEFPFVPQNDGDYDLKTKAIDYRVQFFGFGSRWNQEISMADIILYYARQAEFNCGESVRYWAEYFLEFNAFDIHTPSRVVDDILKNLNAHTYFNEERATFGLFGLTRESMNQAITIANRNIDRSVTYEIEFNEFLKSIL